MMVSGYGIGERNEGDGRIAIFDFAIAYELMVAAHISKRRKSTG